MRTTGVVLHFVLEQYDPVNMQWLELDAGHVVVGTALQYFMLVHCIFGSVLLLYLVVTVAP